MASEQFMSWMSASASPSVMPFHDASYQSGAGLGLPVLSASSASLSRLAAVSQPGEVLAVTILDDVFVDALGNGDAAQFATVAQSVKVGAVEPACEYARNLQSVVQLEFVHEVVAQ